ncbi:MAG: FAD-dependent monooxygenase [Calditrichaeota bacterium]|nr:FAD-dependent monooxygenase [Calditrichota bacterium]
MSERIVHIVGAGPVGLVTAIFFAVRGFRVVVHERRPDPLAGGIPEGRSINLALSRRGLETLARAGLDKAILEIATPMRGRLMHNLTGDLTFQPYGRDLGESIHAVSRGELNRMILSAALKHSRVEVRFGERCVEASPEGLLTLAGPDGQETVVDADVVIGCDGSGSVVRRAISSLPNAVVRQEFIDYDYKELTIPAGPDGSYQMEKNALHIWPRGRFMLIALPNAEGSFTCTLFLAQQGDPGFSSLTTTATVAKFFRTYFPDTVELIPNLEGAFLAGPNGSLPKIDCWPWHIGDRLLLLGDAAHGIVPFLGQGLNCALESVALLFDILDRSGDDWAGAFDRFARERKVDTDAISVMAIENFVEMRDRVADPGFLLQKQVEHELERRFPHLFRSRYGQIQFTRVRYRDALEQGLRNDWFLGRLVGDSRGMDQIDWDEAKRQLETGF